MWHMHILISLFRSYHLLQLLLKRVNIECISNDSEDVLDEPGDVVDQVHALDKLGFERVWDEPHVAYVEDVVSEIVQY